MKLGDGIKLKEAEISALLWLQLCDPKYKWIEIEYQFLDPPSHSLILLASSAISLNNLFP